MDIFCIFIFEYFVFLYFESIQLSGYFWWRPLFWRSKEMASLISPLWSPKQQISDSWLFSLFGLNCKHTTLLKSNDHRSPLIVLDEVRKINLFQIPKFWVCIFFFIERDLSDWKQKIPFKQQESFQMMLSIYIVPTMCVPFWFGNGDVSEVGYSHENFFLELFPWLHVSKICHFTDSAYTERYMGLPVPEGNWKGFTESSLIGKAEYIQDNRWGFCFRLLPFLFGCLSFDENIYNIYT